MRIWCIRIESRDLNIEFRESYDDQISKVLAGPCTSLFRKILRKYVPGTDFLAKIEEYKKILLPALDDTQQLLLYPGRGSFSVSYRDFDLSLLYTLLKSICGITAHKQGWGNSPNSTDTSLAANIDRIMDIHVTHSGDAPPGVPKQSDFDRVMKKVIHISGKIDDILDGSTEAVGTHDQSSRTIQDKKKKELQEHVLEALKDVSLSHKTGSPATQISSITVPGVDDVSHICVVTSDRLWVSDEDGRLLQVDSTGQVLHDKLKGRIGARQTGSHTVTEDGDLLFTDNNQVRKLTSDETVTTLLTTGRGAFCIHSSRINGDILVGSTVSGFDEGRLTRYDRTGRKLQVIKRDDKGQRLYGYPKYITENQNGDILISDGCMGAVVVVDKSGRHRFNYTGRQSDYYTGRQSDYYTGRQYPFYRQTHFSPHGICTEFLGHVLVCDHDHQSVHLLDQDGQFLSLLLTREQHGLRHPTALCVDDQHNLYLGHWDSNTINVYKYLQHTDVK